MKKYILTIMMVLSMMAVSCGNPLKDCSLSEVTEAIEGGTPVYTFDNKLDFDYFIFYAENVEDYSGGIILEKTDGESWYVLFDSFVDGTAGQNPLVEYEEIEKNTIDFDFTEAWMKFGEGRYRVLVPATVADTGEKCYVAREITVLDSQIIEKKETLQELLSCITDEEVEKVELAKGKELISITQENLEALLNDAFEMQCVGTLDSSLAMGPLMLGGDNARYYAFKVYFEDGTFLLIRNSHGKDLNGNDYSAVCKITGMEEAILLNGEQEWLDILVEKIQ